MYYLVEMSTKIWLVIPREFTKLFQQQQHELENKINILVFWCKSNRLLYGSNHCKSYYNSPCWNSDCWQVYKYNNCFYIYSNGTAYEAQNIFDLKNVLHGHSFSSNALILL